jgi:hypothetical protein
MDDAPAESAPSSFTLGTVDEKARPEHLVILVNGIAGSALNWKFAAEQFKLKLGDKVIVHCSSSNSFWKTFSGVDIMGARLAKEVMDVVKQNPDLKKISFIGHSLGGLISRYAIGQLYAPPGERSYWQERAEAESEAEGSGRSHDPEQCITYDKATVAGLEAINFITLATPHLGCRDNQNLPFLFGLVPLEKIAPLVSHLFIGRTGKHLFLADGRQPLLELMVTDCSEGRFLSALRSFKQRTAYANVGYDHMVGWRTASIRKEGELPEVLTEAVDPKYPHIVREETVIAREGHGSVPKDAPAKDLKEEVMVSGLQQLLWWRIDVNFSKAKPYYAAHNLIQVKVESQHGDGEDVIRHVIDKHFLDLQSISE